MFILVQLVLLIDFAHNWSEAWTGKKRYFFPEGHTDIQNGSFQQTIKRPNQEAGSALYYPLLAFSTS